MVFHQHRRLGQHTGGNARPGEAQTGLPWPRNHPDHQTGRPDPVSTITKLSIYGVAEIEDDSLDGLTALKELTLHGDKSAPPNHSSSELPPALLSELPNLARLAIDERFRLPESMEVHSHEVFCRLAALNDNWGEKRDVVITVGGEPVTLKEVVPDKPS